MNEAAENTCWTFSSASDPQRPSLLTPCLRACACMYVCVNIIHVSHELLWMQENGQLAERNANECFERLFETLQERKSEMLRSIEQSRNLRVERLRAQVEEYQGMLENSGLVGYAQEVLKETDQSCFVQTAKQLHVRLDVWQELKDVGFVSVLTEKNICF